MSGRLRRCTKSMVSQQVCLLGVEQIERNGQAEYGLRVGPIVRINPYELHVNDPDYYDELYNFKKYDKYGWHVQQFGHPASSANTVTHQLHKMRRGAIAPYFSRGMILRLEKDVIQKTVEKLCKRIEDFQTSKRPLPIGTAYRAFTTDVITDYTMGTSFNFLDRPDFYEKWFDEFLENVRLVHTVTHYPWLPGFAKRLPLWLRGLLLPKTAQLLEFHHVGAPYSPSFAYIAIANHVSGHCDICRLSKK